MTDRGGYDEEPAYASEGWTPSIVTLPSGSAVMRALARGVDEFCSLERRQFVSAEQLHHAVLAAVHRLCVQVVDCRAAGFTRDEVVDVLAPVREIHARSPFVSRLQQWPRGYPGDFETVEYICRGAEGRESDDIPDHCETYALNLPIAQQHRNKVQHQAARIGAAVLGQDAPRILALACGSCPDFGRVLPLLERTNATIVLNDADSDALAFARKRLASVAGRCVFIPGNALTVARKLGRSETFDLVLAGGLFDYLPEKHASFLVRAVVNLLNPDGSFFFTNIARGNPYASLIEHLGDWFLIERSKEELLALGRSAGIPAEDVTITRDETGLAFLVDVVRRGGVRQE